MNSLVYSSLALSVGQVVYRSSVNIKFKLNRRQLKCLNIIISPIVNLNNSKLIGVSNICNNVYYKQIRHFELSRLVLLARKGKDKIKKMPETTPSHHINGYANGHAPPELQQAGSFLFTSESVGEGHPGMFYSLFYFIIHLIVPVIFRNAITLVPPSRLLSCACFYYILYVFIFYCNYNFVIRYFISFMFILFIYIFFLQ